MLALVAASGNRGIARDKILAYLWPEATPAKARASLEQMLHALRVSLGDRPVFLGNPIRLDPEHGCENGAPVTASISDGKLKHAGLTLTGSKCRQSPANRRFTLAPRFKLAGARSA